MRVDSSSKLSLLLLATGAFAAQPSSLPPIAAPLRDLPWAQLNFLHTTDTHGWLAGHLREPSYGADWGDYISFTEHLRNKADADGSDLLVIDSGDRIEGNGLYDAAHPKGKYILKIFGQQDVDVLCSGNHELYKNHSSYDEYQITVPQSHGNYLASNIDIFDPETGERRPLAQRYKKFTTKNQGIRIVAFGFLYDFSLNSNNTIVQKVEDAIKEPWFQTAIRDRDVDLFLVVGHVPLRSTEFPKIFRAIRGQNWDTPIQFFGGHLHIRDYARYDRKAAAIESGRFMETVGFMSISGLNVPSKPTSLFQTISSLSLPWRRRTIAASPVFNRRYIDNNLFSFYHHTGLNETTFPTESGLNVSNQIKKDRRALGLDSVYGCAPHDYWTTRVPFPSNESIFTWLQDEVLPDMVQDKDRKNVPGVILSNTGAIRFDIFAGPFTVDSMYTISPFTSGFRCFQDVPFSIVKRLLTILNAGSPPFASNWESLAYRSPIVANGVQAFPEPPVNVQSPLIQDKPTEKLMPGYTTVDDAGNDGDDTIHTPIKSFGVPNIIESRISFPDAASTLADPDQVDLIYVDFLEPFIILALRFLGTDYDKSDVRPYMDGQTLTSIIGDWVQGNWRCENS